MMNNWDVVDVPSHQQYNNASLIHKTKELAICETTEGTWVVIEGKSRPMIIAEYISREDALGEWSHA